MSMRRKRLSRKCSKPRVGRLAAADIKAQINQILYQSSSLKYPEHQLLRVVVRSDKAHHLQFLKGFTEWRAVGTWENYPDEHNTVIEIQYHEDACESNGERLKNLFAQLNDVVIGEEKLFFSTYPIEVTSL
jgi:hypothetical protein